jgi:hypothetical protein
LIAETPGDDDAPIGPGAEEESFIAAERQSVPEPRAAATPQPQREEVPAARLDDLVARIPPGTQKALHDLLRARFTRVRRMRDGELR